MEQKMRRFKQMLSQTASEDVLKRNTCGVLSLLDDDLTPYGVPLSYCYTNGCLYFHCAKAGRKLNAIKANPRASFCVVDKDQIIPSEFTTYFRSVIVSGSIEILENEDERRQALFDIGNRYSPNVPGLENEVASSIDRAVILKLTPSSITGKQAKELMTNENL